LPGIGPQSKRRAARRTLEKSSAGPSFSNFDRFRINNFQFKTLPVRKKSPTIRKRLSDLKAAVLCTLDGSDCSLGKIISARHPCPSRTRRLAHDEAGAKLPSRKTIRQRSHTKHLRPNSANIISPVHCGQRGILTPYWQRSYFVGDK
jgi:hypothetical protein